MFHTYPDAEFPLPLGLAPDGMRSWTWMELSISTPIFIASLESRGDDEADWGIVRHLWLTSVNQVNDVARQTGTDMRLVRLALLSPGYLNDEGVFKLDQLKQIWRHHEERNSFLFVLGDGRSIPYSLSGAELEKGKLELVLSI